MSRIATSSVRRAKHHQPAGKVLRVLICAASTQDSAELERLLKVQSGVCVAGAIVYSNGLAPAIAKCDPDVVILQLGPQSREIQWAELIAMGVPVVLLVDSTDLLIAASAMGGGVQAVIAGEASGEELAAAANSAALGLFTFSGEIAELVRNELAASFQQDMEDHVFDHASVTSEILEPLTLREQEVLEMMSEGLSNKEIAARLDISANTVKFHISSIFGKLGASSRTEATTVGLRHRLITI